MKTKADDSLTTQKSDLLTMTSSGPPKTLAIVVKWSLFIGHLCNKSSN